MKQQEPWRSATLALALILSTYFGGCAPTEGELATSTPTVTHISAPASAPTPEPTHTHTPRPTPIPTATNSPTPTAQPTETLEPTAEPEVVSTSEEVIVIQEDLSPEALEQRVDEISAALVEELGLTRKQLSEPTLSTEGRERVPRSDIGLELWRGEKESREKAFGIHIGGWVVEDLGFSPAGERVILVATYNFPDGMFSWASSVRSPPVPVPESAGIWGGMYKNDLIYGMPPLIIPVVLDPSTASECQVFRSSGLSPGGNPLGKDLLIGDGIVFRLASNPANPTIDEKEYLHLVTLMEDLSKQQNGVVFLKYFRSFRATRIELSRESID